jgi:Ketopantoate reductase PanE/ApbA C terminal
VAKAVNFRLNLGDPIEHMRKPGGKIPDARPAMLLDYNAGRRCEVDAINGAIPRLGKPLGVPKACQRDGRWHHQGTRATDARLTGHGMNSWKIESPGRTPGAH